MRMRCCAGQLPCKRTPCAYPPAAWRSAPIAHGCASNRGGALCAPDLALWAKFPQPQACAGKRSCTRSTPTPNPAYGVPTAAKRRAVQTLPNDAEFKYPGWSPITWITVGDLIGEKLPDSPDDMKPALIVDTKSAQLL